jgi:hypothetical protein
VGEKVLIVIEGKAAGQALGGRPRPWTPPLWGLSTG